MMIIKMKKILKLGILLGFLLFVCTQVLNVRSPITIEQAKACDGTVRVYGYATTPGWWGPIKLGGVKVTLTKPDGTKLVVYSSNDWGNKGYFEFTGTPDSLPDGDYSMKAEKRCYNTVSTDFSMEPYHGAEATITMVPCGSGSIGIVPFFPWY
jgi:hypothetical protein